MRAYYQGQTYLVEFTDSDTHCFTAHTHGDPRVVTGRGAFIFDSGSGDLVGSRGAAAKHEGETQWLAFSQDAQNYARGQLSQEGLSVNPFDFAAHMPEFAANPKGKSPVGRRVELIHTPDHWTKLKPGAMGTVAFVDDTGTIFVDWDQGSRLGLVPGVDHFQYATAANPDRAEHKRLALDMLDEGQRLLQKATARRIDYDMHNNLEAHNEACSLARAAYTDALMADSQALHLGGDLEGRIGTFRDNVVKLLNDLRCPWSDIMYNWADNPAPARISRTRGVKTMRGPYDARRGYKPWITRRGKLGTGFLTSMSKADRHKSLDRCVREYGYRSCLGSIMALERAKRGPRGTGEGVGAKYAKKLTESREFLVEKYGGPGSFGPQKEQRISVAADAGVGYRAANPEGEEATRAVLAVRPSRWPKAVREAYAQSGLTEAEMAFAIASSARTAGWSNEKIAREPKRAAHAAAGVWALTNQYPRAANPSDLQEISRGEITSGLDLDSDQERLLDELVLAAKMDGNAYRDGSPARAVSGAFKTIARGRREDLQSDFKVVDGEAVRLVRNRWRQGNPCFGLHVHGEQVGPVLRQIQGNPGKAWHLKAAHDAIGLADTQLGVALSYLAMSRPGSRVAGSGKPRGDRAGARRDACEYAYASIQQAREAWTEYRHASVNQRTGYTSGGGDAAYQGQMDLIENVMIPLAQIVLAEAKCAAPAWKVPADYDLDAAVAEYREFKGQLEPWRATKKKKSAKAKGNPAAREHLDMARQLAAQINGGLDRIDTLLSDAHDDIYDDDDPVVTDAATEKLNEAIGILRRVIREIAVYRVELQYAKPTPPQLAALPRYHVPRLEALLRDLTKTASACDTCTRIPQLGYRGGYARPRTKTPKPAVKKVATGKKKKPKNMGKALASAKAKAAKKKAAKKKATKKKAKAS